MRAIQTAIVASLAVLSAISPGIAAQTCPSGSFPPYIHELKLLGSPSHSFESTVHIGRVNFLGTHILAACVEDVYKGQVIHAITDDQGNLLASLFPGTNNICWGDYFGNGNGALDVYVVWKTSGEIHCGVQFMPFAYSGGMLVSYMGSSFNHFHGGDGVDIVYGGLDSDDLNEDVHAAGFPTSIYGEVHGEEGMDFLVGQYSNSTLLRGGPNVDKFYDGGGSNDRLFGEGGDDCCIYDHGHSFATLSGGAGTDGVKNLVGTQSCEYVSTNPKCGELNKFCN